MQTIHYSNGAWGQSFYIIFMDEQTLGLDACVAAIVMRILRNIIDTGKRVVCTIHQRNIDIIEAFDKVI